MFVVRNTRRHCVGCHRPDCSKLTESACRAMEAPGQHRWTAAPPSMNYVLQRQVFSFVWAARPVTLSEVKF
jgi:hypothetical protein